MKPDDSQQSPYRYLKQLRALVFSPLAAMASRMREGLTGFVSMRTLVLTGLALVLLHVFGFIVIPFFPFTTTGTIFVDSPEVYTRERLVNDRYDQDFWLRGRLEALDNPDELHLVVGEEVQSTGVGLGLGDDKESRRKDAAEQGNGTVAGDKPRRLSFEQELRIVSGIRDMIRQQILENMLDDRHDLTGNSVYGLKFDTTVIPGSHTRRRAYVHVTLKVDDLFRLREAGSPELETHIAGWVASQLQGSNSDSDRSAAAKKLERFNKQEHYYLKWLNDLEKRLNRAEDSVYGSMKDDCPEERGRGRDFYDRLSRKTLEVVLGIPEKLFWRLNDRSGEDTGQDDRAHAPNPVKLPDPWAGFFFIDRQRFEFPNEQRNNACGYRVWFSVSELIEVFVVRSREETQCNLELEAASGGAHTDEIVTRFEKDLEAYLEVNTEKRECLPILIVSEPDNPEKWTLAGLNDAGAFQRIEIGPPNNPLDGKLKATLRQALTKEPRNERRIIKLARSALGHESETPLGESEDGEWLISVYGSDYEKRVTRFGGQPAMLKYPLSSALIARLRDVNDRRCASKTANETDCNHTRRREILLPSGLFNFIERMSARDAYSYAIFPKNDVVGVFAETSAQLSARGATTGFFDLERHRRDSTTASVLVGFGHGGGALGNRDDGVQTDRAIGFGWVISARGDMQPTQKSQLALVSVPAWTDTLELDVAVGWINRHGNPEVDEDGNFPLSISVPPTLEAFDSIFREDARVTLGPTIRDNDMDSDIYVRAGKKTTILIPGSRLWRSASVTLGAQLAKRIRVLPNMEGIIAEFDNVDPPYAAYNVESSATNDYREPSDATLRPDGKECRKKIRYITNHDLRVRAVRLRVWTSEGVALAKKRVCVVYDPGEVLGKAPSKEPRDSRQEVAAP